MIFANLQAGEAVFVDANILVYHFEPHLIHGAACTALLKRIELQEITGFTSTHVLSEVAHRLMTLEAQRRYGWPAAGLAQRLRQHPAQIQPLTAFRQALQEVPQYNIQILTIPA